MDYAKSKDFSNSASLLTSNILPEMKNIYNGNHVSLNEVDDKQISISLNIDSHPVKCVNDKSDENKRFHLCSLRSQEISSLTGNDSFSNDLFQPKPSIVRKILEMTSSFSQEAVKSSEENNYNPDDYELKLKQDQSGCLGLSENPDVNFVIKSDNCIDQVDNLSDDSNCSFRTAVSEIDFLNLNSEIDCFGLPESPDVKFVKKAINTVAQEDNLSDDSNCSFKTTGSNLDLFDFHSERDMCDHEYKSSQLRNEISQQNNNTSWILKKFCHQMHRNNMKDDTKSEIKSTRSLSRNLSDELCNGKEMCCIDNEKLSSNSLPEYSCKSFTTHLTFSDALREEFMTHHPDHMTTGPNDSQFENETELTVRNQLNNNKVHILKKSEQFSNSKELCTNFNVEFGTRKFNSVGSKIISTSSIQIKNNVVSNITISELCGHVLGGEIKTLPIASTSNDEFQRRNYFRTSSGINTFSNSNNLSQIEDNQCSKESNIVEYNMKQTNSKKDDQEFLPAYKQSKIESSHCSASSFSSTAGINKNQQVYAKSSSKIDPPLMKNIFAPATETNEVDIGAATITCIKELPPMNFLNTLTRFSSDKSFNQNAQNQNDNTEDILRSQKEHVVITAIKNMDDEISPSKEMQKDNEIIVKKSVLRYSKIKVRTAHSKDNPHGRQKVGEKRKERETDKDLSSNHKKKKNEKEEEGKNKNPQEKIYELENKEIAPLILSRPSRISRHKSLNREAVVASHLAVMKEERKTSSKNESLLSTSPLVDDVKRVFELLRPGCSPTLHQSTDDLASSICDDSITDNSILEYTIEPQSHDHLKYMSPHNPLPNLNTFGDDFSASSITDRSVQEIGGKLQTPPTPFVHHQPILQECIDRPEIEAPQLVSNYATPSRKAKSKAIALIAEIMQPSSARYKRKRM